MKKRTLELPILYRLVEEIDAEPAAVERAEGAEAKPVLYPVTISSEKPVSRWFGNEILSHEAGAVDTSLLKKGLSVLNNHNTDDVRGVLEEGEHDTDKKVVKGAMRFSETALGQDFELDVKTKIRRFISVGYRILRAKLIESSKEKGDTWLATKWIPLEASIVAIPADSSVGFGGRSLDYPDQDTAARRYQVEIEGDEDDAQEENRDMKPNGNTPAAPADPAAPTPAASPAVADTSVEVGRSLDARNAEYETIERLCDFNGIKPEKRRDWIRSGKSMAEIAQLIVVERATAGPGQPSAESVAPMDDEDRDRYSYVEAMRQGAAYNNPANFTGLEGEVDQELRKQFPKDHKFRGGILVPMRIHPRRQDAPGQRTLASNASGLGTETVFEKPGELIEILRNKALVAQLGARLLTGLEGPVAFPRQTGAITVNWRPENGGAFSNSDMALGQVLLTPHTMAGGQAYSRQLLAQSSLDVEMMVRDDLAAGHALAFDLASIHGTGTDGQPVGIYNAQDILVVAFGGAPTYPKLVEMSGVVADANADLGSLAYITNARLAAVMKTTPRHATASGVGFIWNGTYQAGDVDGYKAAATAQVSKTLGAGSNEHGIIFGNWSDLILALWGAMELVVDPYTRKREQLIEVASFQMGDVVIRHGASFAKGTGATLS